MCAGRLGEWRRRGIVAAVADDDGGDGGLAG